MRSIGRVISHTDRRATLHLILLTGAILCCGAGCGQSGSTPGSASEAGDAARTPGKLVIFHAASLARPFEALEKIIEAENPGLDIVRESSSSRLAIRKVTDLGRPADILASADEALLRQQALPEHADWVGLFARNRVVLAFTAKSKHRTEINAQNWYDILLREDVNFGYAEPSMAPVGYRTLLCWKLADIYYRDALGGRSVYRELIDACPRRFIRPHCNELIPLLEALTLDYTFQYRSVALQHHLEWLKLPDEIDLGNEAMGDFYAQVSTEVPGRTRGAPEERVGRPIVYGITIPKNARNRAMAERFLELLFAEKGGQIMEDNFQELIRPVLCKNRDAAPDALRPLMKEAEHLAR
jgi:molybdate/tungstate transport system substrate-binding protein